jgi:pyruvate ferredoxin oxidoreductase alpha subunit
MVEDADCILITLGSITGTAKSVVDELRKVGLRAGVCRIRFMRPFPEAEVAALARPQRAIGVIEKDISFGYEGTVATNVKSALSKFDNRIPILNFIAGLGGRSISRNDIKNAFVDLERSRNNETGNEVQFVNLGVTL